MEKFSKYLPCARWLKTYNKNDLISDLTAAVIVTVLLIPQSLAYALLAGVPPEVGLYGSILPLVVYAIFGTSRTLSVGPVAVVSLMTAATLGNMPIQSTADYVAAATVLALLSGFMLLGMGLLRLGFVANFLSHSVVSGFITASGIIIAVGQLKHVLNIKMEGDNLPHMFSTFMEHAGDIQIMAFLVGAGVIGFLYLARSKASSYFQSLGISKSTAGVLTKTAPIIGVFATIFIAWMFGLNEHGVAIVGDVPAGLPSLSVTIPTIELIQQLWLPAFFISIIGYVESISVGRTLGAKRRQKVDANQELIGLGTANLASSISGAYPVTGGFSRSVVNFDAGASTQMASVFAAVGIALASLFLTPLLYFLPKATLAAVIIVAVTSLIDFSILKKTWRFSKSDFYAVTITILATLLLGVEVGVSCGVLGSIALFLYRTATPHIAEVGLIPETEHFRNVSRYKVQTRPEVLLLRPDESLFFANANYLEEKIYEQVYLRGQIAHVVLICSAINEIDFSALEALETVNEQLSAQGVKLHFAEVKGPVMDNLQRTGFLKHLSGKVFLTTYEAFSEIQS